MTTTSTADHEMPFLKHLQELRKHLVRAGIGLTVTTIVSYIWSAELFTLLTQPITNLGPAVELIGTGPADAFVMKIKVAIAAGLLLSSPLSFYELWQFILPALHPHERRYAIPFVIITTFCFSLGVYFCFRVVFPFTFDFFIEEFTSIHVKPSIRIGEYLSFTLTTLLAFGSVFELPVVCFFLARFRLLSHRWLIDQVRVATVVIFVAAAILTPSPDVISQLCLAVPLMIMYGLCIVIAYFAHPERGRPRTFGSTPESTALGGKGL